MNSTEKMSLLITAIFMLGMGTAFLWTFHSAGSFKFPWEKALNPLPAHTVETTTYKSIGFTGEGGRVLVESNDPKLSRDDCIKLADKYKPVAGQVTVHKPAKDGSVIAFCTDNLDGKGIFFPFDSLF